MRKRVVTIRVYQNEPKGQLIWANVRGLDKENRNVVIDRMHSEALKLIAVRARHRRFNAPLDVHFFPEQTGAHTLIGLLQAVGPRGRKATVKLRISRLAWQQRKKNAAAVP